MDWIMLSLISAFLIGIHTVVSKRILLKEKPENMLFFMSFFISILSLILFYPKIDFHLELRLLSIILFKSSLIAITWFLFYNVLKKLDISIVAPLRNFSPILLIMLSFFILGERLTTNQFFGAFVLIFCVILLDFNFKDPKETFIFLKSKYFIFLMISFFGNSFSAIIDKNFIQDIGVYTMTFYFYFFITIILGLFVLRKPLELKDSLKDNYGMYLIISILFLFSDLTYFFAVAMPNTLISLIIPIRRLGNVISAFIGGTLLREKNYIYRTGISFIMVFGVYLLSN